jgi:hypothetical protein
LASKSFLQSSPILVSLEKRMIRPMEKMVMGYQRASKPLVAVFVILGIFANSMMAGFCLCGQACSHNPEDGWSGKASSPFHNRCCWGLCKSCNIEKGQAFKGVNTISSTDNVNAPQCATVPGVPPAYPLTLRTGNLFRFYHPCGKEPFPQTLQKDLPLIC